MITVPGLLAIGSLGVKRKMITVPSGHGRCRGMFDCQQPHPPARHLIARVAGMTPKQLTGCRSVDRGPHDSASARVTEVAHATNQVQPSYIYPQRCGGVRSIDISITEIQA